MPQPQLLTTFLTVCREGRTIDGREIPRAHIQEMADNYDANLYGARINKEHFRAYLIDGDLPTLGDVYALRAEEDDDKKLCLKAQIAPNSDLVALNERGQKVYTSIEYAVDKVEGKTGAYLFGLAVTDSQSTLGNERLKFAIGAGAEWPGATDEMRARYISDVLETASFSIKDDKSFFDVIYQMLSREKTNTHQNDSDIKAAVELLVTHQVAAQNADTETQQSLSDLSTKLTNHMTEFDQLRTTLTENSDPNHRQRPAGGKETSHLLEC